MVAIGISRAVREENAVTPDTKIPLKSNIGQLITTS